MPRDLGIHVSEEKATGSPIFHLLLQLDKSLPRLLAYYDWLITQFFILSLELRYTFVAGRGV